ncbi:MAG: DUF411 domain-containing protein [Rudaea sp.]
MKRRAFLGLAAGLIWTLDVHAAQPVVDVYKSPTCGCCGNWVRHLRANGFAVNVNDVADVDAVRAKAGVPAKLASCHTAFVTGYVIEGHVPAAEIRTLLAARPNALGLAVAGMPAGAPGMDGTPAGGFDVLLFQPDGTSRTYRAYPRG